MNSKSLVDIDHQLEKLEFALALSQSKGDTKKSATIKSQIEKIGINFEEPGT